METLGKILLAFIFAFAIYVIVCIGYEYLRAVWFKRDATRKREQHFRSLPAVIILVFFSTFSRSQTVGQMIVSGGLMYVSGYADGVAETVQFNYNGYTKRHPNTNPTWSNPDISWRNKWKDGNPEKGPAFTGSTHIFVGLTDLYHLGNTIRNTAATTSIIVYGIPQFRQQENDWWKKNWSQWIRVGKERDNKNRKPALAYIAEFGFLTACRGAGFTTSYNWVYGGN